MINKPELLHCEEIAGDKYEFRRGTAERPLTIWRGDTQVAYFWHGELRHKVPNARYEPEFLVSIGGITPWPGREIQAAAVAAYRASQRGPVTRVCEG